MKIKDWLYVAAAVAAFVLGALLFRGCQKPKTSSPEIRWRVLDLDSLKAAWGYLPDTVFLPGPERQVVRYVTVPIPDQSTADSIASRYAELAKKYTQMEAELQAAWKDGQGDAIEWKAEEHTYVDSITTANYFHRWEIVAEGPILSYMPQIIPFCPPAPTTKAPKLHRIGVFFGGQTASGALRPVYSGKYSYNWISVHAGYLPPVNRLSLPGEFQVSAGVEIPIR
jgi:hypothetical protein